MSWVKMLLNPKNAGKAYNAYKSVKPLSKIKGSKSVSDVKNKSALSKFKAAGFNVTQNLKKTAKELNKVNETLKKNKNILNK